LGVEGVDFLVGVAVLGGHGFIRDAGVAQGHFEAAMAEELGDGLDVHAPVDGLGAEGVAQLVGVDVPDPGRLGDPADHAGHDVAVQRPALVGQQQPARASPVPVLPLEEELDEAGVDGDVAVVAEFADGDLEPPVAAPLRQGVGLEGAELADAHAGAGQEFHHQGA
jgi:hypothetical protein